MVAKQLGWEPGMSEIEQTDVKYPRVKPQQNSQEPQAAEIVVDDTATLPVYSNFCRVDRYAVGSATRFWP
jgi:hypothetical protein